jgi:C4-dicarboxylate transporter DctM subunit
MLTGMPISISLGLTVLVFIFTMTKVPIESIGLKLFTGIEKFEIMAVPFFILAGNFLTHGGVARRMINFATSMVGHFHGGLALSGIVACAMFALVCGSSVATVVAIGSIGCRRWCKHGYPMRFGTGRHHRRQVGILMPSIPKKDLRDRDQHLDRRSSSPACSDPAHHDALHGDVVHRANTIRAKRPPKASAGRRSATASGA